jgi:hypothetical protein
VGRSKICTRRVSGIDLLGAVIGCGCTRTSLRAPTPELGRTGEERPRAVGEDPAVAAAETIGQPGLRQGLQRLLNGVGVVAGESHELVTPGAVLQEEHPEEDGGWRAGETGDEIGHSRGAVGPRVVVVVHFLSPGVRW